MPKNEVLNNKTKDSTTQNMNDKGQDELHSVRSILKPATSKDTSSFCKTCYCLDPRYTHWNNEVITSRTVLETSAANGCSTCDFLVDGISVQAARWREQTNSTRPGWESVDRIQIHIYGNRGLEVKINFEIPDKLESIKLDFYLRPGDPSPWPAVGRSNDIPTSLELGHCLKKVERWLQSCCQGHPECHPKSDSSFPTRLLDVTTLNEGYIKLVESSSLEIERYVALSHCWGKTQAMTTVKANFDLYSQRIMFESLPKTFQDAVSITEGLGVKFLWIDSLCIIQDDPLDWEAEAGRMAAVYSSSYLTLAALHSENNMGGCFSERYSKVRMHKSSSFIMPTESITVECVIDGIPYTVMTRHLPRDAHSLFLGEAIDDTPLGKRAWAFQERLLSPRTLFFHHEELIWECNRTLSCECQFLENVENQKRTASSHLKSKIKFTSDVPTPLIERIWLQVVEFYVRLKLTMKSDLLPALSGLARHFSESLKSRYLAGLWSSDLTRSLYWKRVSLLYDQCEKMSDSPNEHASWSWASAAASEEGFSIDFRALRCLFTQDEHFRVLTYPTARSDLNPYDGDLVGRLQLRAACITTRFLEVSSTTKTTAHLRYQNGSVSRFSPDLDLKRPGPSQIVNGGELMCLLIGRTEGRNKNANADVALVLKQAECQEIVYRRVGLLELQQSKNWFEGASVETIDII